MREGPSCTVNCVLPCGISHAFESAPGRRSCGIEQGWSLLGASISQLRHVWQEWSRRSSRMSPRHRWATQSSWSHSSRRRLSPTAHASSGSHAEPLALVAVLWNVESQQQPQNRSSIVVRESFARQHDTMQAFDNVSALSSTKYPTSCSRSVPMSTGGLCLRSATRGRFAAYWASWADSLSTIQSRGLWTTHVVRSISKELLNVGRCCSIGVRCSWVWSSCPRPATWATGSRRS